MKNHIKNLKSLIPNGFTQKEFSKEIGVSENTMYNWCKGKPVSLTSYFKIFNYFSNNLTLEKVPNYVSGNKTLDTILFDLTTQIDNVKKEYRKAKREFEKETERLKQENILLNKKNLDISEENRKIKSTLPTKKQRKDLIKRKNDLDKREYNLIPKEDKLYRKERELEEREKEVDYIKNNLKERVIKEILEIDFNKFNIDIPRLVGMYFTTYANTKNKGKDYDDIYRQRRSKWYFDAYTENFITYIADELGDFIIKEYKKVKKKK